MDGVATNMHNPADSGKGRTARPGVLVTGHYRMRAPYRALRPRGTRDWLLGFTVEGRGLYRQEGVELGAEPGDLVLLEPGAFHDYGCVAGSVWEFLWAHFIARPGWIQHIRLWPREGRGLRRVRVGDEQARRRIEQAFRRCHQDASRGGDGLSQDLALNALGEIMLLSTREARETSPAGPLSPRIRDVLQHLANHLSASLDVPTLAKIARLSPSRFAHRFRDETGKPVIGYLLEMRLWHASRLLEFTGRSIKEIAAEVGFHSPFYFSRQFRQRFSASPREFRRRAALRAGPAGAPPRPGV